MAVWIAILLATIQRKFCIKFLTRYHTLGWVRIFVFMTSLRESAGYESLFIRTLDSISNTYAPLLNQSGKKSNLKSKEV